MKTMYSNQTAPEVITFRNGDVPATIVTNGESIRTYTSDEVKGHRKLNSAIAHLEYKGYSIMMDEWL